MGGLVDETEHAATDELEGEEIPQRGLGLMPLELLDDVEKDVVRREHSAGRVGFGVGRSPPRHRLLRCAGPCRRQGVGAHESLGGAHEG